MLSGHACVHSDTQAPVLGSLRNEVHQLLLECSWAVQWSTQTAWEEQPGGLWKLNRHQLWVLSVHQSRCVFIQQLIQCCVKVHTLWQVTYILGDLRIRELRGCDVIGWQLWWSGGGAACGKSHRATNEVSCELGSHVHRRHVNDNAAKENKKSNLDFIFEGKYNWDSVLKLTVG